MEQVNIWNKILENEGAIKESKSMFNAFLWMSKLSPV